MKNFVIRFLLISILIQNMCINTACRSENNIFEAINSYDNKLACVKIINNSTRNATFLLYRIDVNGNYDKEKELFSC